MDERKRISVSGELLLYRQLLIKIIQAADGALPNQLPRSVERNKITGSTQSVSSERPPKKKKHDRWSDKSTHHQGRNWPSHVQRCSIERNPLNHPFIKHIPLSGPDRHGGSPRPPPPITAKMILQFAPTRDPRIAPPQSGQDCWG